MRDPFAKARGMQAQAGSVGPMGAAQAPGLPVAPQAPQPPGIGMAASGPAPDFHTLAKHMGVGKLDKNPVVARVQLIKHLVTKIGAGYKDNPAAQGLLSSFDAMPKNDAQPAGGSVKHLLG